MAQKLVLKAPLSGVVVPLARVPDPVFAQKMVGDGVAIDPLGESLSAPCDGEVLMLHAANHAITLAAAGGVEVLMHVGLDTIAMKGEGFTPRVKKGDKVKAGAPLIDFDADLLATRARSLLSMIVVTNPDRVAAFHPGTGRVTADRDVVLELELRPDPAGSGRVTGSMRALGSGRSSGPMRVVLPHVTSEAILVPNRAGLHARPAAVLAGAAKRFPGQLQVMKGEAAANAKSITSLLALDVRQGDRVRVSAQGDGAQAAVTALAALIAEGLGEEGLGAAPKAEKMLAKPAAVAEADPGVLVGVAASPGLAVGRVFRLRRNDVQVPETGSDPRTEERRLEEALEKARRDLSALQSQLAAQRQGQRAAIFTAHEELLDDPELQQVVHSAIAKGKSAAWAWQQAVSAQAERLSKMHNALLAGRAADLRDVGRRVLGDLTGVAAHPLSAPPGSILVAEELVPSDTAQLDPSRILGFCTALGGATSHVAIIARAMDLPAVAAIDARALDLADDTPVILDGTRGTLRVNPSPEELVRVEEERVRAVARKKSDAEAAQRPAQTRDGRRIEVAANIGGLDDAGRVVALGGEGVGLLRTEFLFLHRTDAPSEDEQARAYAEIARELGPDRPLVIRTLDVGGDKPLPYLPLPREENPFLGERGLRIGLDRPEILRAQLRAILRAATQEKPAAQVLVMFPMVATLAEFRMAKAILDEERARLGAAPIPTGIMIEIPAAALMAEQFAREADFFSIGTNDLTQYTLAMDRGHPKLAPHVDALNPSVLQLIARTVEGAKKHGRWVGVCGGMASDPQAVPILVGLGVGELSVPPPSVPVIKAVVRGLEAKACEALAERALQAESAAAVRALVKEVSR